MAKQIILTQRRKSRNSRSIGNKKIETEQSEYSSPYADNLTLRIITCYILSVQEEVTLLNSKIKKITCNENIGINNHNDKVLQPANLVAVPRLRTPAAALQAILNKVLYDQ